MKIKKNDQVLVISGKDRGKKGKVTQVFASENKLVIDGVNKCFRHLKSQRHGESGQKIEFFGPIHASNVKLICPACGKPARVGFKISGDRKDRICRKCQATTTKPKDSKGDSDAKAKKKKK